MALLKSRWALLLLTAAGCADTESLGHASGWLKACASASCAAESGEHFRVQAYFDADVSRYAPHGFYAYFELERADGQRGVLELDVPLDSGSETVTTENVSYRELDGSRIRFESRQVTGELQLTRALTEDREDSCGCGDGLFDLRFVAPGPDGTLGTADDLTRELDYGNLSRLDEPCLEEPHQADATGLRVSMRECSAPPPTAAAPSAPPSEPPRPSRSPSSTCSYANCERDDGSYTTVESGCGGTSYNDSGCGSTSSESSGGCSDSSGADSGGGCGSNTSGDNHDESDAGEDKHKADSGCEGDTSNASSSSSCSTARVSRRDLRSFLGTGLPLVLLCAWQGLRARRMRRGQRSSA